MKRAAYLWLTAGVLAMFLVSFGAAQSQSLGDYARQVRKQKAQKAAGGKQFDDDSMPKHDTISVIGHPSPQTPADDSAKAKLKPEASDDAQANDDGKSESKSETQPKSEAAPKSDVQAAKDEAAERDKSNKEWQKKLNEQKSQIDMLSRELDVMQREYRLRAAAMYADAGNRLRNSSEWDKEDADYKQKVAAKQKAIDDARLQLEDMKEEARKAGVPAPYRE